MRALGLVAFALLLAGCPKRDTPMPSGGGGDAEAVDANEKAASAADGGTGDASSHVELALALPWTEAIRND
jgi:hypothetical protein